MVYQSFIAVLRQVLASKKTVRFINTYFGMTVSHNGTVLQVKDDRALFQVPKSQLICMARDRTTLIESEDFPSLVSAGVRGLDLEREVADLVNFESVQITLHNRSHVRIELKDLLHVSVIPQDSEKVYSMSMTEISLRGMSVVINTSSYPADDYGKGCPITVIFKLPVRSLQEPYTLVKMEGVICHINLTKNTQNYRLGISTHPNRQTERVINRFLAQRQRELCQDLKIELTDTLI
jgi:hypothetical protein